MFFVNIVGRGAAAHSSSKGIEMTTKTTNLFTRLYTIVTKTHARNISLFDPLRTIVNDERVANVSLMHLRRLGGRDTGSILRRLLKLAHTCENGVEGRWRVCRLPAYCNVCGPLCCDWWWRRVLLGSFRLPFIGADTQILG